MPDNYFARYLPLLMHFGLVTILAVAIVVLSWLVGQHKFRFPLPLGGRSA